MIVEISTWLSMYYGLVIIIMSCCCNPLSVLVFSRRAFRGNTTALYLRFLALVDMTAVLTAILNFFHSVSAKYHFLEHEISCRIHTFVRLVCIDCSSWILVAVTLERACSILWPFYVKSVCTMTSTRIIIVAIVLALALANSPVFVLFGDVHVLDPLTNQSLLEHCMIYREPTEVNSSIFWTSVNILGTFCPSLILTGSNVVIIKGLISSRKSMERFNSDMGHQPTVSRTGLKNKLNCGKSKGTFLTVTLIFVNSVYVLCNFPACIYSYFKYLRPDKGYGETAEAYGRIFLLLMYTNNTLNFVFYCAIGSKFRKELRQATTSVLTGHWSQVLG